MKQLCFPQVICQTDLKGKKYEHRTSEKNLCETKWKIQIKVDPFKTAQENRKHQQALKGGNEEKHQKGGTYW